MFYIICFVVFLLYCIIGVVVINKYLIREVYNLLDTLKDKRYMEGFYVGAIILLWVFVLVYYKLIKGKFK